MRLRLCATLLAGLGLALLAGPGRSLAQTPERNDGQPAGEFDYYLMSFSIAPSFCALSQRNAEKRECADATDAAFRETPLTVHGLWPNREGLSVNQQPQYCASPPFVRLAPALRSALDRYMPGVADGLDRYEWKRHGSCSGLPPDAYFAEMVKLAQRANDTIGAAMREGQMFGRQVKLEDLLRGVAAKDPALAPALVMYCRFSRRQGEADSRAYVTEIRLTLARDLTPIPTEKVGVGQNSGCPGRAGFLPGGFDGAGR